MEQSGGVEIHPITTNPDFLAEIVSETLNTKPITVATEEDKVKLTNCIRYWYNMFHNRDEHGIPLEVTRDPIEKDTLDKYVTNARNFLTTRYSEMGITTSPAIVGPANLQKIPTQYSDFSGGVSVPFLRLFAIDKGSFDSSNATARLIHEMSHALGYVGISPRSDLSIGEIYGIQGWGVMKGKEREYFRIFEEYIASNNERRYHQLNGHELIRYKRERKIQHYSEIHRAETIDENDPSWQKWKNQEGDITGIQYDNLVKIASEINESNTRISEGKVSIRGVSTGEPDLIGHIKYKRIQYAVEAEGLKGVPEGPYDHYLAAIDDLAPEIFPEMSREKAINALEIALTKAQVGQDRGSICTMIEKQLGTGSLKFLANNLRFSILGTGTAVEDILLDLYVKCGQVTDLDRRKELRGSLQNLQQKYIEQLEQKRVKTNQNFVQ